MAPDGLDRHASRSQSTATGDSGTGLVGSIGAVLVFLCFMLFSVQLLVDLYGTSVVTSVCYDGARHVARRAVDHGDNGSVTAARFEAEAAMREMLGSQGERTTFDWSASTGDEVVLRVRSRNPRFLLPGVQSGLVVDDIDRTVRVRIEELR